MSCPLRFSGSHGGRTPTLTTVVATLLIASITTSYTRAEPAQPLDRALASVRRTDLSQHINTLASDTLRGRAAGTDGGHAAGAYLVQQLRRVGLKPAGVDGDFYQEFSEKGFRNVLSVLPGTDPQLKDRYIVIGAHYDHVGLGTKRTSLGGIGQIHNGADDNASGSAAVLEVAEALAGTRQLDHRRSILFVFWDAEELGLLGSKYWTAHPTIPVSAIDMMLNVDMVGRLRDDRLVVFGSRTAAGLRRVAVEHNTRLKQPMTLDFNWDLLANSDHHPFFSKDIPVLFLHTGLHGQYHRPSDDADRIAWTGLERVTRLLLRLTHDAACRPETPGFRRGAAEESEAYRRQLESSALTAQQRLGATWDPELAGEGIIQLTAVADDTAADEAKLKKGDRLLKLGNVDIENAETFAWQILSSPAQIEVLTRRRNKRKLRIRTLLLPGEPQRLGFEWYVDDAEPRAVVVSGVSPASPAGRAGLKNADRIVEVNGRPMAGGADFAKVLRRRDGTIQLRVERRGRYQPIRLPLHPAVGVSSPREISRRDDTPDRRGR